MGFYVCARLRGSRSAGVRRIARSADIKSDVDATRDGGIMESAPKERFYAVKPRHSFFVGIDSHGRVFDSMEIKPKECFIPNIIKHCGLGARS
jgi:hypothetical protein